MEKEWIVNSICNTVYHAIEGKKQLNRAVILIDSEIEKNEILSCIDITLKNGLPDLTINVFRIDLSTVLTMSELSDVMKHKIFACQNEMGETGKAYGLFVFDNLDQANGDVLNGVKEMYHEGRDCRIPDGWEFISFCRKDAKIWDIRFKISTIIYAFNEED